MQTELIYWQVEVSSTFNLQASANHAWTVQAMQPSCRHTLTHLLP